MAKRGLGYPKRKPCRRGDRAERCGDLCESTLAPKCAHETTTRNGDAVHAASERRFARHDDGCVIQNVEERCGIGIDSASAAPRAPVADAASVRSVELSAR